MWVIVFIVATFVNLLLYADSLQLLKGGGDNNEGTRAVITAILQASQGQDYFLVHITDLPPYQGGKVGELPSPRGGVVFQVTTGRGRGNVTQEQMVRVVDLAQQLRRNSKSMTLVVVSDDPIFLTTFAQWSLKGRLLVWSTRLLVLTRLPLHHLQHLRYTLSMTNSMLLFLSHTPSLKCDVFVVQPYSSAEAYPIKVAAWTSARGLRLTLSLFPEKFYRLATGPHLKVARVPLPTYKTKIIDDPSSPGGKRLIIFSPHATLLDTVSRIMNFTFTYEAPSDRAWGVEKPDGSWTGMIGQVKREEVDIGLGPFDVTEARAKVVDYTFPVNIVNTRIISARGRPEVDPWSFLLPLSPLVWAALAATLAGVIGTLLVLPSRWRGVSRGNLGTMKVSNCIRILLQQDISEVSVWWWWERFILGLWMLTMLVLIRSYVGNLLSLLAVRYIPLPIQTLQDIIDKSVTMLIQKGTAQAQTIQTADSGIYRELSNLENEGRFLAIGSSELNTKMDSLVRRGDHVLIMVEHITRIMMAQDFSKKGQCDFYLAQEQFMTSMAAMTGQKGSPLIASFSRRVMQVREGGLYDYWFNSYTPNITACLYPPTTMAVKSSLSLTNLSGTLIVLVGGMVMSALVFGMELLYFYIPVE